MDLYALGHILGKTLDELMDMSVAEFRGWAAFLRMEAARRGKQ